MWAHRPPGVRFEVRGLRFTVDGVRFRVLGLGSWVQGSSLGLRARGVYLRFRVGRQGVGLKVEFGVEGGVFSLGFRRYTCVFLAAGVQCLVCMI